MLSDRCRTIDMWVISTKFSARCGAIVISYRKGHFYDVFGSLQGNRDMLGQQIDITEGSFLWCSRPVVGQ